MKQPYYTCCEDGMLSQTPPVDDSGLCPNCHPGKAECDGGTCGIGGYCNECPKCHGKGYTDEGDPEVGSAIFECEACAGKPQPVAWLYDWMVAEDEVAHDWVTTDYDEAHGGTMGCHNIRPLFAAPSQPLPDEVLEALWEADTTSAEDCRSLYYFKLVARLVEKQHGIVGEA